MLHLWDLKETVAEIKRKRKVLDLTQKKLANLAEISQAALARIEKSPKEYNPSYSAIYQISTALDNFSKKPKGKGLEDRTAEEIMHRKVVSIKPNETLHKAIELMKGKSFSQLPVIDKDIVIGTIYEKKVASVAFEGKNSKQVIAREIIEAPLLQIDKSTPLIKAKSILEHWPAVLVTEKNKIVGIVTVYDLLKVA